MDYEKAYNEALERARKMMNSKRSVVIGKQALETIFPQLRESEDERIRKNIVSIINQYSRICAKEGDSCDDINECLAWLEKQKEQKPVEWSEEDELMRTAVIQTLKMFDGRGTTDMQIDWLKSLRPQGSKDSLQTHWKPSEEQMKALQNAVAVMGYEKELTQLYEQLKSIY